MRKMTCETNLSARVATSGLRRIFFSSPRWVDHTSRVMWIPPIDTPYSRIWVSSIDVSISLPSTSPPRPSMTFSLKKCRRDSTSSILNQWSLDLFDKTFNSIESRLILTLCFDSTVNIDGLLSSVIKTSLPYRQSVVHHFFYLVLKYESQAWGSVLVLQLSSRFSRRLMLQNLRASDPYEN